MKNKVLVIIVTYNAMRWCKQCLDSILESSLPLDVYIVDNGSTDGTQRFVIDSYPNIKFIQSEKNLGFGAANNLGLRYAVNNDYDYVYLLNQDAWIFGNTVERLISASESNPNLGILSPLQLAGSGDKIESGFKHSLPSDFPVNEPIQNLSKVYKASVVNAAHWFIPIRVIKKVGGFSPTFFHYGEDYNYINRILYHGYSVGIVSSSLAVHDRENRSVSIEKEFYLKDVANLIRLSNPSHPFCMNVISTAFYALSFSVKSRDPRPIRGYMKQLLRLSKIKENRRKSKLDAAFL